MTFEDLDLIEPICKALVQEGYTTPTPIQSEAIPIVSQGYDLLGCAQTGTGKTAAFSIPIIQRLYLQKKKGYRRVSSIDPYAYRELAIQIGESFAAYGRFAGLRHTVIFGGVGQKPQTEALERGIDILIATPGRLLDLIGQGFIHLEKLNRMRRYCESDMCRRRVLLSYFGEEADHDCGNCDVCKGPSATLRWQCLDTKSAERRHPDWRACRHANADRHITCLRSGGTLGERIR